MDPVAAPADLLPILAANQSRALALLEALINVDSGSRFAAGVNRVADLCAARLAESGWSVERLPPPAGHDAGDVVIGRLRGGLGREHGGRRVLLSAHMDTVFATGTVAARPFTVTDGIATGPGVIDDKCGIVAAIEAVDALVHGAGWDAFEEVVLVLSCDEELGSPVSGPILTREAAHADVGFGLEAARRTGDLVSARKGVAEVTVHVEGRAAHAGVEPHKGVHALLEAAHLVIAIQGLNGRWPDVSLNVGPPHRRWRHQRRPRRRGPHDRGARLRDRADGDRHGGDRGAGRRSPPSRAPGSACSAATRCRRWRPPLPRWHWPRRPARSPTRSASAPATPAPAAAPTPASSRRSASPPWTASARSAATPTPPRSTSRSRAWSPAPPSSPP